MNELETRLLATWNRVTQAGVSDPKQPFFEAGGDSMLLLEFQLALGELGIRIPYMALYEFPSVSSLARELSRGGSLQA